MAVAMALLAGSALIAFARTGQVPAAEPGA
jgi:hypothetical protein